MKTKVFLIMMFVMAGFVVPGWAEFQTVGVYDPFDAPHWNDADQSALYSASTGGASAANVIDLAYMQANIGAAFDANMGGVVDGEGIGDAFEDGAGCGGCFPNNTIRAKYGIGQGKTLEFTQTIIDMVLESGESGGEFPGQAPISGDHRFHKPKPSGSGAKIYGFRIDGITNGLEGEKLIVFGATYLDIDYESAFIRATATFSDGSTVQSTSNAGTGGLHDEDCFVGFKAPEGKWITHLLYESHTVWLDLDDIGFITSADFPPSSYAGPDQTVQLYDADSATGPGVTLAGSVALGIAETYTYTWSGDFVTIDENGTTGADDAVVTFTTTGQYLLTLNVTGSISGPLLSDTVTIFVPFPIVDAGPDQTVQLSVASTTGVTLDGSVDDPYGGETYTYTWSGGFATIDDNGTAGAFDPNVTFTATGDHILTLDVTGSIQGALASDTVTIHVVIPVLDAGDDVQVERTIAPYPGVYLDSTIFDPIVGETYTYAWSNTGVGVVYANGDDDIPDPVVSFPATIQEYIFTLDVTGDTPGTVRQDTVTVNVVEDYIMVSHFPFDPNYQDSSTEGDPNNHTFIVDELGGSTEHDGVVDCDDDGAYENSNNAPLEMHLDHVGDPCHVFNDTVPHLDNLDTAITVAFWIKNDYGQKVWAIEKVGTFAFGIDDMGDLRTQLWFDGAGDPNSLTKSRDGSGLGNDLENNGLKINADGAGGGHEHVWHHIAFTYDSFTGYVEQFLDGALIREDYVGSGQLLTVGETSLFIGRNGTAFYGEDNTSNGLRGAIDDIRIYNYPLEYSEIAGLASMGQAATLVYAGDDVTIDPNEMPYELSGRFIRLGQSTADVNPNWNRSDPNNPYVTDTWGVRWEQSDPNDPNQVTFSDTGDPESDVTFPAPGTYMLRLVSYEELCQSGSDDNDIRSEIEITVLAATDCAGARAFGLNLGNIAGDDCIVGLDDLAVLLREWMLPVLP